MGDGPSPLAGGGGAGLEVGRRGASVRNWRSGGMTNGGSAPSRQPYGRDAYSSF
jgi:hypothetical protein